MLEAANAMVPRVKVSYLQEMIAKGDTLIIDVRDAPEVEQSWKVPGLLTFRVGCLVSCGSRIVLPRQEFCQG